MDNRIKKRFALITTTCVSIAVAFTFCFSNLDSNSVFSRANSNEVWTHYLGVAPTLNEKGTREYWISCSSNEHQFVAPVGVTIREGSALSRSFVNSLANDDDRLVPSYTEIMGFEDGNVPTHVTPKQNISSLTIVDDGTEGNKCLKITVSGSDYGVYFSKQYLDAVFADSSVVAINFDAKGSIASSNFRAKIAGSNTTYEQNDSVYGLDTNWKKFSFKREYYDAYISGDAMIFGGGMTNGNYVLVDNIVPVTEDLTSFGFENGYLNTSTRIYNSAGHSNSQPAPEQTLKLLPDSACTISNMGFDYEDKTEGNRSFRFDKTNGYLAIYLSTAIKNAMGDGVLKFDFKTTVVINSNPSVKNATNGVNQPLGGDGYKLVNNEWLTIVIPASGVSSDGRFLILQGSTGGTMHIDNIRFEYYETTINLESLNRDIYISDTTGSTLFPTKRAPSAISALSVDGVSVSTSNIKSFSSSGINLSNQYLSTLSSGDHKIIISYYFNSNHVVEETYYQNVYFGTLKSSETVSTTYGSADYYTLPGNYTDLYRIVCNGVDIPFERINSGSNYQGTTYKVPCASLVEALPTINNQKSSGSIVLHIFTLNEIFRQPITVNLTTTTVKTVTQYNGGDIPSFYYSSTRHGYNTSTEYETYLSVDNLNEYLNGGNEIIYEQTLHVGANVTSLSTQIQYLFANAAKLGKKVMISDDAFTTLGREESTLIGRNITVGSSTLYFSNTSELDAYVTNRLNIYINNSACYGVNVGDEETYKQLVGGYTDLMHSIHRCLTALNREDFYVNCNLQPRSATKEVMTGVSGSSTTDADYLTYLNAYVQASGNDYISYDYYPLGNGNFASGYGVGEYVLRNLIQVAQVAKDNNLKVHVITQTFSPGHSSNTLLLNSEDVSYLNNMLMAFGVRQISYFTFFHRGSSTGSETWLADGCPMTADGNRTNLYYYMQAQRKQIKEMAPVINCFDFEWFYIYRASTSSNRINNPPAYTYLYNNKPYSTSNYHQLISVGAPSKGWTSVTGLVNSDTGQYMYTAQNILKNKDQASVLQTIQLNFNSNVSYFAIYENGSVRIVNAVANGSNKKLSLELSSGHTAFIVAY